MGSIVRDPHTAEDITQVVFAKLMKAILKYERRDVPFAAWIISVARNVALNHIRASRQVPLAEVRTSDEGTEQVGFEGAWHPQRHPARIAIRDVVVRRVARQLGRERPRSARPRPSARKGRTSSATWSSWRR